MAIMGLCLIPPRRLSLLDLFWRPSHAPIGAWLGRKVKYRLEIFDMPLAPTLYLPALEEKPQLSRYFEKNNLHNSHSLE
jgi:hypothetical protein